MSEVIALIVVLLLVWLWKDSSEVHEQATRLGAAACKSVNAQFLDQTVVLSKLRLCRTSSGTMALFREYRFDFSIDGVNRREGCISMCGKRVLDMVLDVDSIHNLH